MEKNKINPLAFLAYFIIIFICTLLFVIMFHISFLNKLDVFFYRGCIFLIICSGVAFALSRLAERVFPMLRLDTKDALVISLLFFGITLAWFVLAPTTVERSVSVFMLSYMEENEDNGGITAEEFGDIFYDKYIESFEAFDKRFHEQVISGNMKQSPDGNGYVITSQGRFVVEMFRLSARLFNTEQWLVYPNEY